METMMQNKIESENVCITDADPHTDVRTLWKRTFILLSFKYCVLFPGLVTVVLRFLYSYIYYL